MKSLIRTLIALTGIWTGLAQAQVDGQPRGFSLPMIVQRHFEEEFHDADNVTWRQTGDKYVASFVKNTFRMDAYYTDNGVWLKTEIDVPLARFPEAARTHLSQTYGNWQVNRTGYHDAEDARYYWVDISGGGGIRTIQYDDDGVFLRVISK
ncbi:MAG: hypothetical protein SF053_01310 [Bacteroidia bacterium]|nr:hypothetical protein [Bacteroidia bacterium]